MHAWLLFLFFCTIIILILSALEHTNGCILRQTHIHLVAEQISNVVDAILDHGWSFQRQSPGNDAHVLRQTHGRQHLRLEHARVSNLRPLLEIRVVSEDLHGGFRVGVEGGLEAQLGDAIFFEKGFDGSNEISKAQVLVRHQSLDLVKFAEMRGVHGFVAEDSIDGKVSLRGESAFLVGELVKHL